jgi:1,4-dihydroxy-2-naphthoate octaprenyltransferase
MRIPFSFFLMPVFWLAVAVIPVSSWSYYNLSVVFFVLHFLLYPASNGYNSLIDKDEGPVGGLKSPPKTNIQLQVLVVVFDLLSLIISFLHNIIFGYFVAIYWMVSKAYSSPQIRIKKYPYASWLVVAVFQGGLTVLMVWSGVIHEFRDLEITVDWIWPTIATLLLAGSYPMTQIYQHEEDIQRGDYTISTKLGIRGTFVLAGIFLFVGSNLLATALFFYQTVYSLVLVLVFSIPSIVYFIMWAKKTWKDSESADFNHTMQFNKISSLGLSLGFFLIICLNIWSNFIHLHPN